jgi:hypothetical protein
MFTCPVCGYPRLRRPAKDFLICSSCGTEFGYDDAATSHIELRRRWLGRGAPWFSRATAPPDNWNPILQLVRAGYAPEMLLILQPNSTVSATQSTQYEMDVAVKVSYERNTQAAA